MSFSQQQHPLLDLSSAAKSTAALLLALCDPLTEFSSPFSSSSSSCSSNNNNADHQHQELLKIHETLTYQRYNINAQRIPDASSAHYAWNMLLKYVTFIGDKSIGKQHKNNKDDDNNNHHLSKSLAQQLEGFLLVRRGKYSDKNNQNEQNKITNEVDGEQNEEHAIHSEELDIYELFGYVSIGSSEKENLVKKQAGQRRERTADSNTKNENENATSSSSFDNLPSLSDNHRNFALVIQQLALCVACLIVGYKSRGTLQHIYPVSRAVFPRVLRILAALFYSDSSSSQGDVEESNNNNATRANEDDADGESSTTSSPFFLSLQQQNHNRNEKKDEKSLLKKFTFPHQLHIARYFDRSIIVYEMLVMQFFSAQSCQLTPVPFSMIRTSLVELLVALNRLSSYPQTMISAALAKQFGIVSYEFTRVDLLNPSMIHYVDPKTKKDDDDDDDDEDNKKGTSSDLLGKNNQQEKTKTSSAADDLLPDLNSILSETVNKNTKDGEPETGAATTGGFRQLPELLPQKSSSSLSTLLPHEIANSQSTSSSAMATAPVPTNTNTTTATAEHQVDEDDWFGGGEDDDQQQQQQQQQQAVDPAYSTNVVHFTLPDIKLPSSSSANTTSNHHHNHHHQTEAFIEPPPPPPQQQQQPKPFFITDLPASSSSENNNQQYIKNDAAAAIDHDDDELAIAADLMFKTDEEKRIEIARRREAKRRKEVCGSKRIEHMLRIIRKIYNDEEEAHALKMANEEKKRKFEELRKKIAADQQQQQQQNENGEEGMSSSAALAENSIFSMKIEGLPSLIADADPFSSSSLANDQQQQQQNNNTSNKNKKHNTSSNHQFEADKISPELKEAHDTVARWTQNAMRLLSPWSDMVRRLSVHDVWNHYNTIHMRKIKEEKMLHDEVKRKNTNSSNHENYQQQQGGEKQNNNNNSNITNSEVAPELKYLNQFSSPHQSLSHSSSSSQMKGLLDIAGINVSMWLNRWRGCSTSTSNSCQRKKDAASAPFFTLAFTSVITRLSLLAAIVCDFIVEKRCDVLPSLLSQINRKVDQNEDDDALIKTADHHLDELNDKMPNYQVIFEALTFFSLSSSSSSGTSSKKNQQQYQNSSTHHNNTAKNPHQQQRNLRQEHAILRDYFGIETSSQLRNVIFQLAQELVTASRNEIQREQQKVRDLQNSRRHLGIYEEIYNTATSTMHDDHNNNNNLHHHQNNLHHHHQQPAHQNYHSNNGENNNNNNYYGGGYYGDHNNNNNNNQNSTSDQQQQQQQQQQNNNNMNQPDEDHFFDDDVFYGGEASETAANQNNNNAKDADNAADDDDDVAAQHQMMDEVFFGGAI